MQRTAAGDEKNNRVSSEYVTCKINKLLLHVSY